MTIRSRLVPFLAAIFAASPLVAQEILAVDWNGDAFAVNHATGSFRALGPTGFTNCNAMAEQSGICYLAVRNGSLFQLATIDPFTLQTSLLFTNLGVDLRGLAAGPSPTELFGIANGTPSDRLVRIDLGTGQVTNVGPTGRTSIQSLVKVGSNLWAFDLTAGLLAVSPVSGAAFDPFPFVGASGADIQYLAVTPNTPNGVVFGGNHRVYQINLYDGTVTPRGSDSTLDLRGGEFRSGEFASFGLGCTNGVGGTTLQGFGAALAGTPMTILSPSHAAGSTSFLHMSFGTTSVPVPGLSCPLLVPPDTVVTFDNFTGGTLKRVVQLPPVFGVTVHMQLLTLENATDTSLTNRLDVRMPL